MSSRIGKSIDGISDDLIKMIESNPLAFATSDSRNNPNVIAVGPAKLSGDKILILDNYMKQAKDNVISNPNVCLAVWDSELSTGMYSSSWADQWRGYKIIGKAEYFPSQRWGKYKQDVKDLNWKMSKGLVVVTVIKIISLG